MGRVLLAWIGLADLKGAESDGSGPIAQAVAERSFDYVVLLNNFSDERVGPYEKWLKKKTKAPLTVRQYALSSPTHYGDIYNAVVLAVAWTLETYGAKTKLTFHLSPGTPAMASIWIIAAKTRFEAELIESSKEKGVATVDVPFQLAAEFIPAAVQQTSEDLARLAEGQRPEEPKFGDILHRSEVMKRLVRRARQAAPFSEAIFIEGESGTGKQLLAEAIHQESPRKGKPFVEVTRHRLIDQELLDAGWDVGPSGKSTEQVRQEVQLSTMPTESREGYADYVLYGDDGKPLAVVEAKKTAKDARVGAEQARIYATCLEKETGQRPVTFYANGIDIYIWDDAQGYTPRKVYGFYSKDSLEYLLYQRRNKKALATVAPNLGIAERMYQLEAIKRVCERFEQKFRRALLVQATGTGKTRVAVSLCELLMRAGWAKRILFLCDRRELRRQADNVFKEFLPGEPRVVVDSSTSSDRDNPMATAALPRRALQLRCELWVEDEQLRREGKWSSFG